MAASVNKVFLMGNLTRDPELRYVPSGTAVANFTVAVNRVYATQTGEKKEEVTFVRIVVWGRRAEVCGEYLSKGSPVFVEGRLRARSWQTPDGQNRSTTEVIANSVQFLSSAGRALKKEAGLPKSSPEEVSTIDIGDNQAQVIQDQPDTKSDGSEEVPF